MWRFPQHTSSIDQLYFSLNNIAMIDGINRTTSSDRRLLHSMYTSGIYNPRYEEVENIDGYDKTTAGHKIGFPRFYQGVYQTTNNKLFITPNGELLLKYWDDHDKRKIIFISMLLNIQFPNDYTLGIRNIEVYPFRIIFELLLDKEINQYLTLIEMGQIVFYVNKMKDEEDYLGLKKKILEFRKKTHDEKKQELTLNSEEFVKNYVNCRYSFVLLRKFGILNEVKVNKKLRIQSPSRPKGPTPINCSKYKINKDIMDYVKKMLGKYSLYQDIVKPSSLKDDWIREVYNYTSKAMIKYIGEEKNQYLTYVQLPEDLINYSKDGEKWYQFEETITQAFNMFDNIKAEHIGGPGEPDVLCHNTTANENFVCDAKSRKLTLIEINDGRLKQHRSRYNGEYTLVITPDYRDSALWDIEGTNTCIITSYCFSDLISRYVVPKHLSRMPCNYDEINNLIKNNLGKDTSKDIYNFIDQEIGISKKG